MTTPYLSRPKRSELEARIEAELKALPNKHDTEMLEVARVLCVGLEDALDVIHSDAAHEDTRTAADEAAEYAEDARQIILRARKLWKDNPTGMDEEIKADRLSHDKDVAADLRKGE